MPETIDFKISEIPELDETGMEALEEVFAHIKVIPSDKPRKIVLTISIDPETYRICTNIETRLPKAAPKQWQLTTFQGIRENGTLRIEKPAQAGLFEGGKTNV